MVVNAFHICCYIITVSGSKHHFFFITELFHIPEREIFHESFKHVSIISFNEKTLDFVSFYVRCEHIFGMILGTLQDPLRCNPN